MPVTKTFPINFVAADEAKCKEAAQAAIDIVKSLTHDDLLYLADLSKKNPGFVKKAKPYVHLL